jgi:hypothetical protein
MRKRAVSILALVLVWLSVVVAVQQFDRDQVAEVLESVESAESAWMSEDLYLALAARDRGSMPSLGGGGVLAPQFSPVQYQNPARVRVLVLGDSFTVGTGLSDLDARWTVLLEEQLDARTAPGTFEVVALAHSGTSTFTHAAWAASLKAGSLPAHEPWSGAAESDDYSQLPFAWVSDADAGQLFAPFDAVVVGFVDNDVRPGRQDRQIPAAYHRHVEASLGPDAVLEAYVPVESKDSYDPDRNPNLAYLAPAAEEIAGLAPPGQALWVPLPFIEHERDEAARARPFFEASGFVAADTPTAERLVAGRDLVDLMVTPVDWHPNTALLHAYATDTANALWDMLPDDLVATAAASAVASLRPLVSNVLPADLEVDEETAGGYLRHLGGPPSMCWEGAEVLSARSTCDGDDPRFVFRDGTVRGAQFAPCAPLGRPYAQVMLDRSRTGEVTVDPLGSDWAVWTLGYDDDGFELRTRLGVADRPLSFTLGQTARGFLLESRRSQDCNQAPPRLPAFTATFSVAR